MIQNDLELKTTQERIVKFESWVAQFRVTVSPEEFKYMAGGYLAEIDQMHSEVMAYLGRHSSEFTPAKAA
jgi:hypothetical protein